jgi:ribosomal protein L15
MINCIFRVPFNIDRPVLQALLKTDGYNASYDSNGHAGVKIKYVSTGKKITIFVFESGSIIIILGKQGFYRINEIHAFIYKYLLVNYENIVKDRDIAKKIISQYIVKLSDKTQIKLR